MDLTLIWQEKLMKKILLTALAASMLIFSSAQAETYWNLPVQISDSNTIVGFEVDTTWHTVHGKTANISGNIMLSDPKDYKSIQATVVLPVSSFNTNSESRDKTLRESMSAQNYPKVTVKVTSVENICAPKDLDTIPSCAGMLVGSLTIRDTEREVRIPAQVSKQQDGHYLVSGSLTFSWAAFGVEDPSIFIAKVNENVTVKFEVTL